MKNRGFFLFENSQFLVKFSIYLNRRVFVMLCCSNSNFAKRCCKQKLGE